MRPTEKGLTIVEILVAMIILLIGVVSVLALFPVAIRSAKRSANDTISARIADSVCDSLTIAMRTSTAEDKTSKKAAQATMVHDGLAGDKSSYTFALPSSADPAPADVRFFAHPANNPMSVAEVSPKPNDVFRLGSSKLMKNIINDIKTTVDPAEPYDQFAFTFTINRVDDQRPETETGDSFNPKSLYQFAISIYRIPVSDSTSGGTTLPDPIRIFIVRLSGQ